MALRRLWRAVTLPGADANAAATRRHSADAKKKRRDHLATPSQSGRAAARPMQAPADRRATWARYFIIDCAALNSVWSSLPSRFESALLKVLDSPRIREASRLSIDPSRFASIREKSIAPPALPDPVVPVPVLPELLPVDPEPLDPVVPEPVEPVEPAARVEPEPALSRDPMVPADPGLPMVEPLPVTGGVFVLGCESDVLPVPPVELDEPDEPDDCASTVVRSAGADGPKANAVLHSASAEAARIMRGRVKVVICVSFE